MKKRRVFILYRSPLFARGLSALLSKAPGMEVVGMGPGEPVEEGTWKDIQHLVPDVIILEQEDGSPLSRALDAAPAAQLVALSLSHNRIRTYEHRDVQGRGLEDDRGHSPGLSGGAPGGPGPKQWCGEKEGGIAGDRGAFYR